MPIIVKNKNSEVRCQHTLDKIERQYKKKTEHEHTKVRKLLPHQYDKELKLKRLK